MVQLGLVREALGFFILYSLNFGLGYSSASIAFTHVFRYADFDAEFQDARDGIRDSNTTLLADRFTDAELAAAERVSAVRSRPKKSSVLVRVWKFESCQWLTPLFVCEFTHRCELAGCRVLL